MINQYIRQKMIGREEQIKGIVTHLKQLLVSFENGQESFSKKINFD